MPQLNIHVTPDFAEALETVRQARGLRTKSETVRLIVQEAAARLNEQGDPYDFDRLIGLAAQGKRNRNPRFGTHDSLFAGRSDAGGVFYNSPRNAR